MRAVSARRDLILRWIMAGPLTLLVAVLLMACAPLWLPKGAAGIDNLIFPLLLFPLFWAVSLFYSLIEPRPLRGFGVILAVILVSGFAVYRQF